MKWRVAYLVFAVVAGLLLTVGNAWVCALAPLRFSLPPLVGAPVPSLQSQLWPFPLPQGWQTANTVVIAEGPWITKYKWVGTKTDGVTSCGTEVVESGWPFRLMRTTREVEWQEAAQASGGANIPAGLSLSQPTSLKYPGSWTLRGPVFGYFPWLGGLPLAPLWARFLAHWLFLSLLLASPLIWRTAIETVRRWRNLCPACAYSLAGLPPSVITCPECGKRLHAKSATVPPDGPHSPTPTAANDPAS